MKKGARPAPVYFLSISNSKIHLTSARSRHKNNEQASDFAPRLHVHNTRTYIVALYLLLAAVRAQSNGRLILKCHTNQRDSCKFRASARYAKRCFKVAVILFQAADARLSHPRAIARERVERALSRDINSARRGVFSPCHLCHLLLINTVARRRRRKCVLCVYRCVRSLDDEFSACTLYRFTR